MAWTSARGLSSSKHPLRVTYVTIRWGDSAATWTVNPGFEKLEQGRKGPHDKSHQFGFLREVEAATI